jgi:hypothetical protein
MIELMEFLTCLQKDFLSLLLIYLGDSWGCSPAQMGLSTLVCGWDQQLCPSWVEPQSPASPGWGQVLGH